MVKSIKECLDIEKFTPVFSRADKMYLPVGYFSIYCNSILSDGWLASTSRGKVFHNGRSKMDFKSISQVIPRELML